MFNVVNRGGTNISHIFTQQLRHSSKKIISLKTRYGEAPLYNQDRYDEAVEAGRLEDLQFKTIRFALVHETNSVFRDDLREKFVRLITHDGRTFLIEELLDKAFYQIKLIQYKRWMKQQDRKAKAEAAAKDNSSGSDKTSMGKDGLGGEEEEEIDLNPVSIFKKAIYNAMPAIIVEKVKRGGAIYQVPTPLHEQSSLWLAMRWYNDTVKERPKPRVKHFHEVFAQEIVDGSMGRGIVVKKRDDLHRLAHANKAYAHYRWG